MESTEKMGHHICSRLRGLAAVGFVVAAVVAGTWAGPAAACSTPVYRYAMYNWPASPYYVFYFHHGQIPTADAELHTQIESLATDEKAPANLLLEKVDTGDEEALKRFPRQVLEAYEAWPDKEKPFHVVFSPWGIKFHSGSLDNEAIKAMVDSPARQKIGRLLQEGHLTVLVLLPGKDKAANEAAEKAAKKLIADLESGEIDLGPDPSEVLDPYDYGYAQPPADEPTEPGDGPAGDEAEESSGEEQPAPKIDRKVALVKVTRDDPAEQWLVKALMQVEPDLDEYADEPMVFGIYGRGRALPPFVGKGITADNMVDLLFFLSGSCSCQIKEQNPGMDLPMAWDWDAAAEAIAATDPAYADPYGYGYGYAEYPAEMSEEDSEEPPAEDEPETSETAQDESPEQPGERPAEEPAGTAEDTSSAPEAPGPQQTVEGPAEPASSSSDAATKAVAMATEAPGGEPAGGAATTGRISPVESAAARLNWTIGLAVALGAVLIVGAGFAILRRRPS